MPACPSIMYPMEPSGLYAPLGPAWGENTKHQGGHIPVPLRIVWEDPVGRGPWSQPPADWVPHGLSTRLENGIKTISETEWTSQCEFVIPHKLVSDFVFVRWNESRRKENELEVVKEKRDKSHLWRPYEAVVNRIRKKYQVSLSMQQHKQATHVFFPGSSAQTVLALFLCNALFDRMAQWVPAHPLQEVRPRNWQFSPVAIAP